MNEKLVFAMLCALICCHTVVAAEDGDWWDKKWRFRTTVAAGGPYQSSALQPVEMAIDFPLLLQKAGVDGEFDPASVRVVKHRADGPVQIPFAQRTELVPETRQQRDYLAWIADPSDARVGEFDIYFETTDRAIPPAPEYNADQLPPVNLLSNPGFEDGVADWTIEPPEAASPGVFEHTDGEQSLKIEAQSEGPTSAPTVTITQEIDVRDFAGQDMVFECDLLAERAQYGMPISIELRQFRADGSQIPECAVQPRWLTLELAEDHLVQFMQRGRFSPEAVTVQVHVLMRCYANDADTNRLVDGPDSVFTAWIDRVVLRPGERWPWPAASNAGFVEGVIPDAPLNRGFEFTGQRRLGFNGGSEATMTTGAGDHGPEAVHWGLERGTLEFWCRPSWNADDGAERTFFTGYGYLYRLQSRLRKLDESGNNQLEFSIADSNRKLHTVSGPAALEKGQWYHIAATWDHTRAYLQLFVDGERIAVEGPGDDAWPISLDAAGPEEFRGQGIHGSDKRSIPMQAFFGGRMASKVWPEGDAVEAVLDEIRISDVVRYESNFTAQPAEFAIDDNTRALWHFENEVHGVHGGDDRFVRSYAGTELHPQNESVEIAVLDGDEVRRHTVVVKPHASESLFEKNRGDNNLVDRWSDYTDVPDPRFVEYRRREVERTVSGADDAFTLNVEGDYTPLMRWVTFESAEPGAPTTLLPRWRANDNVVPFSIDSLRETLAADATTDAEKAFAGMQYVLDATAYYDAHYCERLPSGRHRGRVSYVFLKALNVYPFDQCGPLNFTLRKLFLALGISSNNAPGTHHQFQQAYYDGDWRLYDLASRVYWLERDNVSVMGLPDVGEDPFAKLRQPGNLNSYFPGRGGGAPLGSAERPHNMDFPMRADEEVSICWQNEGRWFELTGDREPISLANIPPYFANGAIVYQSAEGGEAAEMANISLVEDRALQPQNVAEAASLIYRVQCPYIFADGIVTGGYEARQPGEITLAISFDEGASWTEVWRNPDARGDLAATLRDQVMARYAYWLKLEFARGSEAQVTDLTVRSTFVASALSMPGTLALGENHVTFVAGPVSTPVKTQCAWIERHQSDLGISLNSLSYYNLDHESYRNLFIVGPGEQLPIEVTALGREVQAEVTLAGLPEDWTCEPQRQMLSSAADGRATFTVAAAPAEQAGQIHALEVVVREGEREGERERRVPVQVLVARAPLAREAEHADEIAGEAEVIEAPELSGARGIRFDGEGEVSFDFTAAADGESVIWLRGRWEPGSKSALSIQLDGAEPREVRSSTMIGFDDWTNPARAYTKGFVHFPRDAEEWTWYRIVGPELSAGEHRLTVAAGPGAFLDAVAVLPQNPAVDRAGTNLLANWNYAPWDSPR